MVLQSAVIYVGRFATIDHRKGIAYGCPAVNAENVEMISISWKSMMNGGMMIGICIKSGAIAHAVVSDTTSNSR